MSDLAVRAAMGEDLALRARVRVLLRRVALDVLAEAPLPDDAGIPERVAYERRHAFAQQVLRDTDDTLAASAQRAAVSWRGSSLAASYAAEGATGPSDTDVEWTLLQVWNALAGA